MRKQTNRDIQTPRKTDSNTDRYRQTDTVRKQTNRQRFTVRKSNRLTDRQTETDRLTQRQVEKQTRKTDGDTER